MSMLLSPAMLRRSGSFNIPYAVMLDGSADYFTRTPGSTGNCKTFTFETFVKICDVSTAANTLFSVYSDASNYFLLRFSSNKLSVVCLIGGVSYGWDTTAVFRDSSAHGHVRLVIDTTQATADSRCGIYWNNVGQDKTTTGSGAIPQNSDTVVNSTASHYIGSNHGVLNWMNGILSGPLLVDGTASSQAYLVSGTGADCQPIRPVVATWGTNGFRLDFSNTTDLGNDVSGNSNDWTPTSITGANNAVSDTPTNNFAVLNALYTGKSTLSNGNLTASGSTDLPTIMPDSGNWYFELDGIAKNWTPPAAFPAAAGTYNFGQRAFSNTPTSGYKTLCTANLPTPSIKDPGKQMDVLLYTGNGAARSITGLDFQPDFVWIKGRSGSTDHTLYDSVRGVQKRLETNNTDAEVTSDGGLTAFSSDGFSLSTLAQVNTNSATYVAWCWKAGGAAVANTDGTITSQVSANPTAGFSIVKTTTTGSGVFTIGHGLGSTPSMIIWKSLGVNDWGVYHSAPGASKTALLNSTMAFATSSAWNNTAPTATVFSVSGWGANDYAAYCWAEVPGFSKFGSYTGNGNADGPFVYCGFRPRWLLVKRTDVADDWKLSDALRSPYNGVVLNLGPNSSAAEDTMSGPIDYTAEGFKLRMTNAPWNANGGTYIFAAFAEYPLGGKNIIPGKAR